MAQTFVVIAVLLIALIVVIRFEMFCLTDIAQAPEVRLLSRQAWVVVTIISIPLGGILYLMFGRPR